MNDLVVIKGDMAVCDSLLVAERFHKKHKNVVQSIKRLAENSADVRKMFSQSTYKDSYGRNQKFFFMNRDGFSLLAMGFTGSDALQWKVDYIKSFNAMENLLMSRQSSLWQESREQSKSARKMETDSIKKLIEYARAQGSKHPEKYYIIYTKLANTAAGIKSRDLATTGQLSTLMFVETLIDQTIESGMVQQIRYKDIYTVCKEKIGLLNGVLRIGLSA